jgi:hypothetical protein
MSDGQGTGAERRRAQRSEPGPLRVRLQDRWDGILINISTNGALIQLPVPQQVNARIVIDVEFDHDAVLQLSGRVVRSNPMPQDGRLTMPLADTDYYVALEFDQVADIPDIAPPRAD